MKVTIKLAVLVAAATMLTTGCGKNDSIFQAEKKGAAQGVPAPSIEETKAIAEEGFIYGLPIVMNYAVQYAFAVDRNSGQFKAPFNQIHNDANVFTYKDTAIVTPNSDTPYSMLWLDLRAEPIVVSVPAVEKKRYYSVQLIDSNTYNYGYIGSRATGNDAGDYLVVGPDWKGETPRGIKRSFAPIRGSLRRLIVPNSSIQKTCRTSLRSRRAMEPSLCRRIYTSPRRPPRRPSTSRRSTKRWSRPASSTISTSRCSSSRPRPRKKPFARNCKHRHWSGQEI